MSGGSEAPSDPPSEDPASVERGARFMSNDERRVATEMLLKGESISKISKTLGRSSSTVHGIKKDIKRGISWQDKRTKTRKSKLDGALEKVEEAMAERGPAAGKLTIKELAAVLGCAPSTAHAWQKKQSSFCHAPTQKRAKRVKRRGEIHIPDEEELS